MGFILSHWWVLSEGIAWSDLPWTGCGGENGQEGTSGGRETAGEASAVVQGREEADLTWAESKSDGEKEADSGCLLQGAMRLVE